MITPPSRMRARVPILAAAALAVVLLAPFVGQHRVTFDALLDPGGGTTEAVILWQIRVPRMLVALLGGAALALGGAVFQALFRNPLATPYTLGVASGASFGVALVTWFGLAPLGSARPETAGALAGALLATAVVWAVARRGPDVSPAVLLLAGVAMSFFFSSLILFLQYAVSPGDAYRVMRWLMGGLAAVDGATAVWVTPFTLLGGAVALWHARELDLLSLGGDLAASRGVAVATVRRVLFVATSVMVGGVVAACGPVGFVGLMAPHICRLLIGPDHRRLLPASMLFGGAFLVGCDALARTVLAPMEVPVGVLTAFVGGPFFLWLLLRHVRG